MATSVGVGTGEIELPEDARPVAAALAATLRKAEADLPFGCEPLDFLVALEEAAPPARDGEVGQ